MGKTRLLGLPAIRRSDLFVGLIFLQILLLSFLFAHAHHRVKAETAALQQMALLVENLGLTDLCLFTEANYTRHLSQADLHTPFQDHPLSLEHFPSGSILNPPQAIRRRNVRLD